MNKKVIKTFAFGVSIACGLAVSGLFASSASADDLTSGSISYARSVFAPVKVAYSYNSDSSNSEFEPAIASPDDVTEHITHNDKMEEFAKLPDYNQSDEYLANLDNSQEYDVNVDDVNDDDVNVDDIDFEAIDLDNLGKFASEDVANRCKYTTGGDCAPLPPYASILDGKDHDADNNSGNIDINDIYDDIINEGSICELGSCDPLPNEVITDNDNIDDLNIDDLDLDGNRLDVVSKVDSNSNDNNDNSNESNTNDDSNSNNSDAGNASNKSNTVNVVSEKHDRLSDLHKSVSGRDSHNFAPTLPVPGSQYYYYHNN